MSFIAKLCNKSIDKIIAQNAPKRHSNNFSFIIHQSICWLVSRATYPEMYETPTMSPPAWTRVDIWLPFPTFIDVAQVIYWKYSYPK